MQDRVVNIIRVSEMNVGDKFMWNGLWRTVISKNKRIKYETNGDKHYQTDISANSKQFVQVHRSGTPI